EKGDRDKQAATLIRLGTLYANHSDAERATASYDRAAAIYREAGDRAKEVTTLLAIAHAARTSFTGGPDNQVLPRLAEAYIDRAVQVYHDAGDRDAEASTLISLAQKYELGSPQAERYYERAKQLFQQTRQPQKEAALYLNIGDQYDDQSKAEKMIDYYNRALTIFRTAADPLGEGETCWKLGNYYARAGKAKAADYYNRALLLFERALPTLPAGADRQREAETLYRIGYAYNYFDDKAKVLDYYKRALPLYEGLPHSEENSNKLNAIRARIEELSTTPKEPQ